MNRRSFFNKCASFVAGCMLGVGLRKECLRLPNPDYVDAPQEMFVAELQIGFMDCSHKPLMPCVVYRPNKDGKFERFTP